MKNFKNLLVWQKSIQVVLFVYKITKQFPDDEKYGLTNQMRRSAVSVPSNIAEGTMRTTDKDFRQFISIARGSCAELETQITISYELKYIDENIFKELLLKIEEISKMLASLYSKLS